MGRTHTNDCGLNGTRRECTLGLRAVVRPVLNFNVGLCQMLKYSPTLNAVKQVLQLAAEDSSARRPGTAFHHMFHHLGSALQQLMTALYLQ